MKRQKNMLVLLLVLVLLLLLLLLLLLRRLTKPLLKALFTRTTLQERSLL